MNTQVANTRDSMEISNLGDGAASFIPQTMKQVLEFSNIMAQSDLALPKFLRGNSGACMAISMQAFRWGLDPFAVANKAYSVNDRIAYESQLIAAVINTRASLKNRLVVTYEGDGNTRKCIVTGCFKGENIERPASSPPYSVITPKNSPLWKSDPDQQLFYYTVRLWARRYQPELLMGVYSIDEFEDSPRGPENARDVTPPRPKREEFKEPEFILWDHTGVEAGTFKDPAEYVAALCERMHDLFKTSDLNGFNTVWDNNITIVDSLDEENQLTVRTFFNEMKPKEKAASDESGLPETPEEGEEQPSEPEEPAQEFHVLSTQGDDDIYGNIEDWGEFMLKGLGKMKSKDGVEAFRTMHKDIFAELDQTHHNEVTAIGKAINEALAAFK